MDIIRSEILPGVALTCLRSDKFKTACVSLNLLTQLRRESASMNALIPYVLRRGTSRYRDMEAISARLSELYGTAIEPALRLIGEIQCVGFYASMPESVFLPGKEDLLRDTAELMGQFLLSPVTKGGLFLPEYVDSEKEKMLEAIRSRLNNKARYAMSRCIEEMCCFEDYAVGIRGSEDDCENINYKKLSRHYKKLIQESPIEIFYCGRSDSRSVERAFRDALATLPRGEIDYDIGTDVRMNAVEAEPRRVCESLDVNQGKLVMGFRLGEVMEEPDLAALYVFNCLYGGSANSRLFLNVREKLQLCYYAGSGLEVNKGLMFVSAGIDFDKREETEAEILAQLEDLKQGNVSDEELNIARARVSSDLRSSMDSQGELEGFWLSQILSGMDCGPEELAALAEEVSREDIVAIANSIECDLIYFLEGEESEDGEFEDDDEET